MGRRGRSGVPGAAHGAVPPRPRGGAGDQLRAPSGDAGRHIRAIAGEEAQFLPQEVREEILAEYGLDRPLASQLAGFLARVTRGDLGRSFADKRPVAIRLLERLPWTLLLMGGYWCSPR